MAIAARKPPIGGPTNWFIAVSTANNRLLAVMTRSAPTTVGSIELAAVSNIVSRQPSTKAMT